MIFRNIYVFDCLLICGSCCFFFLLIISDPKHLLGIFDVVVGSTASFRLYSIDLEQCAPEEGQERGFRLLCDIASWQDSLKGKETCFSCKWKYHKISYFATPDILCCPEPFSRERFRVLPSITPSSNIPRFRVTVYIFLDIPKYRHTTTDSLVIEIMSYLYGLSVKTPQTQCIATREQNGFIFNTLYTYLASWDGKSSPFYFSPLLQHFRFSQFPSTTGGWFCNVDNTGIIQMLSVLQKECGTTSNPTLILMKGNSLPIWRKNFRSLRVFECHSLHDCSYTNFEGYDVVFLTYGMLSRAFAEQKRNFEEGKVTSNTMLTIEWHRIVFDNADQFTNLKSKILTQCQTLKSLRKWAFLSFDYIQPLEQWIAQFLLLCPVEDFVQTLNLEPFRDVLLHCFYVNTLRDYSTSINNNSSVSHSMIETKSNDNVESNSIPPTSSFTPSHKLYSVQNPTNTKTKEMTDMHYANATTLAPV